MKEYLKAVGAFGIFVLFITGLRFIYFQSNLGATLPLICLAGFAFLAFAGDVIFDEWIDEQDRQKRLRKFEK